MIIDFHTHSFPEKMAARVLDRLSASSNSHYYLEGTNAALQQSMRECGIAYSVLLPIATTAAQYPTINRVAEEVNEHWKETGILSFGSLHPDNENYREILRDLAQKGFKGIKLHPVYQNAPIDDPRFLHIIDYAAQLGFVILIHAGYDMSFPGNDAVTPQRIHRMLQSVVPEKLVLAHMGGWGDWNYVEEYLLDYPVFLDTSFTLTEIQNVGPWPGGVSPWGDMPRQLGKEQFCRIVRGIGTDRVLFGTDSPWTRQSDSIRVLRESGLTEEELEPIFYDNAARLLGIQN